MGLLRLSGARDSHAEAQEQTGYKTDKPAGYVAALLGTVCEKGPTLG